jgi:DNA-binding XRE family transcriptional regulator
MTTILIQPALPAVTTGSDARKLRLSLHIGRRDLADVAGVTEQTVNLFEHNLPVTLDSKRRILKVLWAKKIGK